VITMSERQLSAARLPTAAITGTGELQQYYLNLLQSLPLNCNAVLSPLITIGITSCYRGEGVSTVAAHLALTAASSGMRVLLVDVNWQCPNVHRAFNIPAGPGLSEVLAGSPCQAIPIRSTHITNLSVLTSGTASVQSKILPAKNLREIIGEIRAGFDLILFDLPACVGATGNLSYAGMLDGVVWVVEAERVRTEVGRRVKALLTRSGANLLGVILNKRRKYVPEWLYKTL
jgi:capsular exopolysaccharide synthesis family protein